MAKKILLSSSDSVQTKKLQQIQECAEREKEQRYGHLRKWQIKPGQTLNPNGRPKKAQVYSDVLRDLLSGEEIHVVIHYPSNKKKKPTMIHLQVDSGKNMYYAVAAAQLIKAIKGDTYAAKEIIDRVQGKPAQAITVDDRTESKKQVMIIAGKQIEF